MKSVSSTSYRRTLYLFIFLALTFLAQVAWWIIFQMRTAADTSRLVKAALEERRDLALKMINDIYQEHYVNLQIMLSLADTADPPSEIMLPAAFSGLTGAGAETEYSDSLYLEMKAGERRYLVFINRDYPVSLLGRDAHLLFNAAVTGFRERPDWLTVSEIGVDAAGLESLERGSSRHTRMLIMEGGFFVFLTALGMYLIYASLRRKRLAEEEQTLFAHSITHELKIPITSIGLYLEALKRRGFDSVMAAELFPKMRDDLKRLNGLIDNILQIKRLSEKKRGKTPIMSLSEDLKAFASRAAGPIKAAGGILETDLNPGITIAAESQEIAWVWETLVDNSLKYARSPEMKISIKLHREGNKAVITISDNGPGIDPGLKGKLFEKFARGESERTRTIPGSGLGLYIAREYVRRNGGEISLENRPEGGCMGTMKFGVKS